MNETWSVTLQIKSVLRNLVGGDRCRFDTRTKYLLQRSFKILNTAHEKHYLYEKNNEMQGKKF